MAVVHGALTLDMTLFARRLPAQGALGLDTITTAVRWFRHCRGRALAIVSLGDPAGEMLFPPIMFALVAAVGWRGSWSVLAAAYALIVVPAVVLPLRERDATREPMDGDRLEASRIEAPASPGEHDRRGAFRKRDASLREALRPPLIWKRLHSTAVAPLVMTGAIVHQVGLLASQGWARHLVPRTFVCDGARATAGRGTAWSAWFVRHVHDGACGARCRWCRRSAQRSTAPGIVTGG